MKYYITIETEKEIKTDELLKVFQTFFFRFCSIDGLQRVSLSQERINYAKNKRIKENMKAIEYFANQIQNKYYHLRKDLNNDL